MIEFRAECGHTVRARNEDAGEMIHCAYCGRRTKVPAAGKGELGSVLAETLEESRARPPVPPPPRTLNLAPLRIMWTAIFVVLVLSVLIYTGRWMYGSWSAESESGEARTAWAPGADRQPESSRPTRPEALGTRGTEPSRRNVLGQLDRRKTGICVFSYPTELDVYVQEMPVRDAGRLDSEHRVGRTPRFFGLEVELRPGKYRVSVLASIRNPDLMELPNYQERVRQAVTHSTDEEEAIFAADDYFIEDGANTWGLEVLRGQKHLVKNFEVEIDDGWRVIYALLLPDGSCADLLRYARDTASFDFDRRLARQELQFWGVSDDEFDVALQALARMGKAVVTDKMLGRASVFQVWPDRSVVGQEYLTEQIPPEP